jgi:hypothetical protein
MIDPEATKKAAELISLVLTVPCVVMAVGVLVLWGKDAYGASRKVNRTAAEWFILGVAVSFVGTALDNIYWTIPWTFHYFDSPKSDFWIKWGPVFNIFFRQLCGILAGYCHIKSAIGHGAAKKSTMDYMIRVSAVIGVTYAAILILA